MQVHEDNLLVINIDNCSFADFDGQMRRWLLPNDKLVNVAEKPRERLSMICAVDTEGRIHYSLSYTNTNKYVFCRFLRDLANRYLDIGCPWDEETVLQVNGASYQTSRR